MDPAAVAFQVVRVLDICLEACRTVADRLATRQPSLDLTVEPLRQRLSDIRDVYASEKFEELVKLRGNDGIAALQEELLDARSTWVADLDQASADDAFLVFDKDLFKASQRLVDGIDVLALPGPTQFDASRNYPGQQLSTMAPIYTTKHRRLLAIYSTVGFLVALVSAIQLRDALGLPLFGLGLGFFRPNPEHAWQTRPMLPQLFAFLSGFILLCQNRGYAGDKGKLVSAVIGYDMGYFHARFAGANPEALLLGYVPMWMLASQVLCWAVNAGTAARHASRSGGNSPASEDESVEQV